MKKTTVISKVNPDESYEFPCSWPIYVVPDGIDPKAVVEKLLAKEKELLKWVSLTNDFIQKWSLANEPPKFDQSKLRPIKKWPNGCAQKDITEEMRAERQEARDFNESISRAHASKTEEWLDKGKKAVLEWIESQNSYPQELVDEVNTRFGVYRPKYEFDISTVEVCDEHR